MKDNALGFIYGQIQHLGQVPSDSLSLAVLIGCQPYGVNLLSQTRQLLDHSLLVGQHLVVGGKSLLDLHAEALLRKVADVTEARLYDVVLTQKTLDGLRFGG